MIRSVVRLALPFSVAISLAFSPSVTTARRVTVDRERSVQAPSWAPGELLVKLRTDDDVERAEKRSGARELDALFAEIGVESVERLIPVVSAEKAASRGERLRGLARVVVLSSSLLRDDPGRAPELLDRLQRLPSVEYAQTNALYRVEEAPNDRYYSSSGAWGQDFPDLWGLRAVGAERAWEVTSGEGVVVAVSDTGVDYTHEDLAANIWNNAGEMGLDGAGVDRRANLLDDDGNGYVDDWHGWDFVETAPGRGDNNPMDDHGHGTHVAGTIAAVRDNRIGIVGVAPKAKIMPVKGIGKYGSGTTSALAKTIVYAAENGADVINASWSSVSVLPDRVLEEAVDFAHDDMGVVVVVAAGNSDEDVNLSRSRLTAYPAALRNVIAVAAVTHLDEKAPFSNHGPKIDVAAPGGGEVSTNRRVKVAYRSILSLRSKKARPGQILDFNASLVEPRYLRLAGTSMASPHVAGVAALVLARTPSLEPEQVRQAIRHGARDVGPAGVDPSFGYGVVDAERALADPPLAAPRIEQVSQTDGGGAGVRIDGTIAGADADAWSIEAGGGAFPTEWTTVGSSSTGAETVSVTWATDSVADGLYTLRLRVRSAGGVETEDRGQVVVRSGRVAPEFSKLRLDTSNFSTDRLEEPFVAKTGVTTMVSVNTRLPLVKVARVDLYDGDAYVGKLYASTQGYVYYLWTPGPVGPTTLRAELTDDDGRVYVIGLFDVNVVADLPPVVYFTNYIHDREAPTDVQLLLTAYDPDGSTDGAQTYDGVGVEIYADGRLLGPATRQAQPGYFEYTIGAAPAGTYRLHAVATDRNGNSSRSALEFTIGTPPNE